MITVIPRPSEVRTCSPNSILFSLLRSFMRGVHTYAQTERGSIRNHPEELDAWYENGWPEATLLLGSVPTLLVLSWEDVPLLRLVRDNGIRWGHKPVFALFDDNVGLFTLGIVGEIQNALIVASPYVAKNQLVTSARYLGQMSSQNCSLD